MATVVPLVQLVEEVSYRKCICIYITYLLIVVLFSIHLYKVKVLLQIPIGVLLVEVVEVPFNSVLVWMLS
jgi:hypothetical protein